jgi:hypothetical protein
MKPTYFTIHPGENPPPQNGCRLKSFFFLKSTGFTSSTFPIQPDFPQNQPAAITLNTGRFSPTLHQSPMAAVFGELFGHIFFSLHIWLRH